jgi:hypothetical protein
MEDKIKELKALQYDDMASIQFLQRRVQERDQEIMRLVNELNTQPKETKPSK